jgi:endonuclease YncB( thermonuclease family)
MTRLAAIALVMLMAAVASAQTGAIVAIDGDTVLMNRDEYRLVGFDTPETGHRAKCESERILGEKARARLQQIIKAGKAALTPVRCACLPWMQGSRSCNNGRFCAILKVNGVDVATTLIKEGLARPFVCGKYSCPRRQRWC